MAFSDILAIISLAGALIGYLITRRARKKADRADSGSRIAAAVEQMAASSAEPDVDFARVFEDAVNARVRWTIPKRDAFPSRPRVAGAEPTISPSAAGGDAQQDWREPESRNRAIRT